MVMRASPRRRLGFDNRGATDRAAPAGSTGVPAADESSTGTPASVPRALERAARTRDTPPDVHAETRGERDDRHAGTAAAQGRADRLDHLQQSRAAQRREPGDVAAHARIRRRSGRRRRDPRGHPARRGRAGLRGRRGHLAVQGPPPQHGRRGGVPPHLRARRSRGPRRPREAAPRHDPRLLHRRGRRHRHRLRHPHRRRRRALRHPRGAPRAWATTTTAWTSSSS